MYCPQCGVGSPAGLQYCRACGVNLKVIGKALTLSEAIARSDRGPLPKLKEMVKNLTVDQVTEEVSGALERLNTELLTHPPKPPGPLRWWQRPKKSAQERRDDHLTKGVVSLFSGIGLTTFLYHFTAALVLKIPPELLTEIPFELEPVVRIFWLVGLVPILSGAGHILAGLLIRPRAGGYLIDTEITEGELKVSKASDLGKQHVGRGASVTEHTTSLLPGTKSATTNGSVKS